MNQQCTHLDQINEVAPNTPEGCEECLESGDSWVSLRMCLTCGHVGCCDSSKNRHATRHYEETGHPIIQTYKGVPEWRWCDMDEMMV